MNEQNRFKAESVNSQFGGMNSNTARSTPKNDSSEPKVSAKSWRTLRLLWWISLFFGPGIYRFYAGKITTGVLWYFTIGGCFIGIFRDGYKIYHGTFTDKNGALIIE